MGVVIIDYENGSVTEIGSREINDYDKPTSDQGREMPKIPSVEPRLEYIMPNSDKLFERDRARELPPNIRIIHQEKKTPEKELPN